MSNILKADKEEGDCSSSQPLEESTILSKESSILSDVPSNISSFLRSATSPDDNGLQIQSDCGEESLVSQTSASVASQDAASASVTRVPKKRRGDPCVDVEMLEAINAVGRNELFNGGGSSIRKSSRRSAVANTNTHEKINQEKAKDVSEEASAAQICVQNVAEEQEARQSEFITAKKDVYDDDCDVVMNEIDTGSEQYEKPNNSKRKRPQPNSPGSDDTISLPEEDTEDPKFTSLQDIDPRFAPGVGKLINGKWYVPKCCTRCRDAKRFCDRSVPCAMCKASKHKCVRIDDQLQPAKSQGVRSGHTKQIVSPQAQHERQIIISRQLSKQVVSAPSPTSSPIAPALIVPPKPSVKKPRKSATPKKVKSKEPQPPVQPKRRKTKANMQEQGTANPDTAVLIIDQADKPPGRGLPVIWCENRQELCETLPYFRGFQSGNYYHDGYMYGYLVDGCASERDYMDGQVIITHAGGKSKDDMEGERRLASHQTLLDNSIKNLLHNYRDRIPVAFVIGNKCPTSPSKIPYRYAVMDWFKITNFWAEKDTFSGHTRFKFRFEKLDPNSPSWWDTKDTVLDQSIRMEFQVCVSCKKASPLIYEGEWTCVQNECAMFWKVPSKNNGPPVNFIYSQSFIRAYTPWEPERSMPPADLRPIPPLVHESMVSVSGGDVQRAFWKGFCCPQCGRLNCRESWIGWQCLNCGYEIKAPHTLFLPMHLADPHRPRFNGPPIPANKVCSSIPYTDQVTQDGLRIMTYQLGQAGTVTHILANVQTNARPYDADWLFQEYQSADMPFKRHAMKNHKVSGKFLTSHYSFNSGEPYKYIVAVDSFPFDQGPACVNRALEVITDRVRLVHPEAHFNEVLNVCYSEQQKMDFHDDGESGLGEIVASISFGCPAKMRFQIKSKYNRPNEHDAALLPSMKKSRTDNQDDIEMDEDMQIDTEVAELDVDPSNDIGEPVSKEKRSHTRVKLELLLSHGDVVVMKGREIQRLWEHAVVPTGIFRMAATARYIDETHRDPKEIQSVEEASTRDLTDALPRLGIVEEEPVKNMSPVLPEIDIARFRNRYFSMPAAAENSRGEQINPISPMSLDQQDESRRRHSFHIPNVESYALARGYHPRTYYPQALPQPSFGHTIPSFNDLFSPPRFARFKESFERGSIDMRKSSSASIASNLSPPVLTSSPTYSLSTTLPVPESMSITNLDRPVDSLQQGVLQTTILPPINVSGSSNSTNLPHLAEALGVQVDTLLTHESQTRASSNEVIKEEEMDVN